MNVLNENKYQMLGLAYALMIYFHADKHIVTGIEALKQILTMVWSGNHG